MDGYVRRNSWPENEPALSPRNGSGALEERVTIDRQSIVLGYVSLFAVDCIKPSGVFTHPVLEFFLGPDGGIGRRRGLKIPRCSAPCEFESRSGHTQCMIELMQLVKYVSGCVANYAGVIVGPRFFVARGAREGPDA